MGQARVEASRSPTMARQGMRAMAEHPNESLRLLAANRRKCQLHPLIYSFSSELDRLDSKKYCIEHWHNPKGKDSAKYQAKGDDDSHCEKQRIRRDDEWQ